MNWKFLFTLSIISILTSISMFYHFVHETSGQSSIGPGIVPAKDEFAISITIVGVTDRTGNLLSIVKVGNLTTARYFNASEYDVDHDGIIDRGISFPNVTISTGANFTACNVVVKDASMSCKSGLAIEGRRPNVQFVLPTFKQSVN